MAFQLARDGWKVEADGRAFRTPGNVQATVRSGVDWFDLDGVVSYGDTSASLSSVLAARQRGEDMVQLSDGSFGLLPTEWLARLGPLFASGEAGEHGTRFRRTQIALLNALLASVPEVDVDATFAQARTQLQGFERIVPVDPPAGFVGVLREYQREGLGWLHFLREFGFGGCLADDMGLGKTIQVLALLEARRADGHGPSLVVVPRSLVFNWRREAERFAPNMRVLDWSATERSVDVLDTANVDLLLVTYGTLRRDIVQLGSITFDYVVLDEAQAIKNSATATAKATRLLKANNRLALSGTPIENRIEELWSVLDFLNPGMLGASHRFASMLRADAPADPPADASAGVALNNGEPNVSTEASDAIDAHETLARALRPVILRRTKAEVAPDLPDRLENTLEVEMEPAQRAFYDGVRDRYRSSLLQRIDRDGVSKSRMHILEALLRLRQAACHPALADPSQAELPSAKLDALLPALAEVAAEGNKALVFSQFTEFLALVRTALDEQGVVYEYLDGRTRDRQERVDRFQNDPDCPLFLISLKAGGHGLNLTAADYVFLLDPWWNPAVEAQAIDRAHRIGRTRQVIATRLVARDTIEEKILQLQASKRSLADAILTADKGVMASIGREELELLLG
jgi:SNF2 family DNA or RNA helicase